MRISPIVKGSDGSIYTTGNSLFIEYNVNSDIDVSECVVVAKNNSNNQVANLNANVNQTSSNSWYCSVETSDIGYALNTGVSYEFTPVVKLNPEVPVGGAENFEGDKKTVIVDYEKPVSYVKNLEIDTYYNQVRIDVYFGSSSPVGIEWLEMYYRVDGGAWKKHDHLAGIGEAMISVGTSYQFAPKGNGKYDFYSIAIDYAGNKESKSAVVEQSIVVDEFTDEEPDTEPEDEGNSSSSQNSNNTTNNNTTNNPPQDNESEEVLDEEASKQDDKQEDINKKEETQEKEDDNKQSESPEESNTAEESSRGVLFWILAIGIPIIGILVVVGIFFQIKYKWINAVLVKIKDLKKSD